MRIDNHAVTMQAQHYNLQLGATEVNIETQNEEFVDSEESSVSKIESNQVLSKNDDTEISVALSKALLQNIQNASSTQSTLTMDYAETQALNFQVKASIQTESKAIELSLDVSLSSTFVQKNNIKLDSTQLLKDPLVLSFDGNIPTLSSQKFSFDIDSDGTKDQVSQLTSNGAFLALDRNSNGSIDNGNELFGTQSGDGFADLKKYDDDNNGWIDENDAIFEKLRVWKKSEGKDELIGVGEVGIGAIFLGSTESAFSIKSDINTTNGEIRSSGFYLNENGKAGVISQIDLVVTPDTQNILSSFRDVQRDFSSLSIETIYKNEHQADKVQESSPLEKLQKKLLALQKQLIKANEEEKAAIELRIELVQSKIIARLGR